MTKKQIKNNIFSAIIFLVFCLIAYYWASGNIKELEHNKRYSTCYVFDYGFVNGEYISYKFTVNGQEHVGGMRENKPYKYLHYYFFVKYSSENHSNHDILLNMPVECNFNYQKVLCLYRIKRGF